MMVRVFVASTPSEWLPARVLEYSIRERCSQPVFLDFIYSFERAIPVPIAIGNRARTPFSFQRFLIPELCKFQGKAIYLDADMLVFRDISSVWDQDLSAYDLQTVQNAQHGRRNQFSVMLLNCETLRWDIDQIVNDLNTGKISYAGLMYEMCMAQRIGRDIPGEWNSLEHFEDDKTALLHYTDMSTQPWVSGNNPLDYLWVACLRRAIKTGFIGRDELEREIELNHVRPSLLAQIDAAIDDTSNLSSSIRRMDLHFVPPFRSLHTGIGRPWTSVRASTAASIRRFYFKSLLSKFVKRC